VFHDSTIAAISSPPGAGSRALIRLSGPRAWEITLAACRSASAPLAQAERGGWRGRLFDGIGEQPVLVLWMPGPASFTGDDVAEWHLCGAPDLVRQALERALNLGATLARPGEFTRRAFENGRMDLSRAEGVLALVHARNEGERRAATSLLLGGLSRRVAGLREQLDEVRALCEASLDFDERETGGVARADLALLVARLSADLEAALAWEVAREVPSGVPRAVLVGRPNAGKSSLFNRLSDASALVSDQAGTTRDALHRPWRLAHVEADLWDTAGVDLPLEPGLPGESGAALDQQARQRARELHRGADLWLWVVDAELGPRDWNREFDALIGAHTPPATVLVLHKLDAVASESASRLREQAQAALGGRIQSCLSASSRTGQGLEDLARETDRLLGAGTAAEEIRELSARHRSALAEARIRVIEAGELLGRDAALDLAAGALGAASLELDQIEGRTTAEDLLDRIFSRFCLGK
jgi:tRNA modification GTPase